MKRTVAVILASSSFFLWVTRQAQAGIVLPPPTGAYSYDSASGRHIAVLPGDFELTDAISSISIKDELDPSPSISLSVADFSNTANAQEYLFYHFAVDSPYSTPTPVDISYSITIDPNSAMADSPVFSDTGELIVQGGGTRLYDDYETSAVYDFDFTISTMASLSLNSGEVYDIALVGGVAALPGGTGSVSVDPVISINPAYLVDHPGVTLFISPGAGNASGVSAAPEPSAWLLMIAGIAGIGMGLRRAKPEMRLTAEGMLGA